MRTLVLRALALACVAFSAASAGAQALPIGAPRPSPQLQIGGTLSVTATPSLVNFNLVQGGTAHGSAGINITTTWTGSFCLLACTISTYAYFTSAAAALSGGGTPPTNIPSSAVFGQVSTGGSDYNPFTNTTPLGGANAGLTIFQQGYFLLTFGGSRTDVLNLEINLAGQPKLAAGNYSGILYIQAESL